MQETTGGLNRIVAKTGSAKSFFFHFDYGRSEYTISGAKDKYVKRDA
jgi:hypothetical protein